MGYGYGHNPRTGRESLACDNCSEAEGRTRKRPCRFCVTHPGGGSLPYCPAPALCPTCWEREGKGRGVHGESCREGAERAQARYDAVAARLEAGDAQVRTAWGSWHDAVPEGFCGVRFVDKDGGESFRLIENERYAEREGIEGHGCWLADYPDAHPWAGPLEAVTMT